MQNKKTRIVNAIFNAMREVANSVRYICIIKKCYNTWLVQTVFCNCSLAYYKLLFMIKRLKHLVKQLQIQELSKSEAIIKQFKRFIADFFLSLKHKISQQDQQNIESLSIINNQLVPSIFQQNKKEDYTKIIQQMSKLNICYKKLFSKNQIQAHILSFSLQSNLKQNFIKYLILIRDNALSLLFRYFYDEYQRYFKIFGQIKIVTDNQYETKNQFNRCLNLQYCFLDQETDKLSQKIKQIYQEFVQPISKKDNAFGFLMDEYLKVCIAKSSNLNKTEINVENNNFIELQQFLYSLQQNARSTEREYLRNIEFTNKQLRYQTIQRINEVQRLSLTQGLLPYE